jgi:TonB family protein
MKSGRTISLVIVGLVLSCSGLAADIKDIENTVRAELQGRALLLRGFPTDRKLSFDSEFNLTSSVHSGPWQAAEFLLSDVEAKGDGLKLVGECLGFVENGNIKRGRKVEISIKGPLSQKLPKDVVSEISSHIFMTGMSELATSVPKEWQRLFSGREIRQNDATDLTLEGEPVYWARASGVTPPKPTYSPDPEYSEAARRAGLQGVVVLAVVVDKKGYVAEAHIQKPAGLGLDEKALEALWHWKFKPALLNGKPVAVVVSIEMSFNLYH